MLENLTLVFTPAVLMSLWEGTLVTLSLTVLSGTFGLLLGLVAALGRMSSLWLPRMIAGFYIETFRGTPLLVQLFFIFFGLPQILGFPLPAYWSAVLGLSLYAGAYFSEIIRGSLNAVSKGQLEASRALGLHSNQTLRFVLIPQATRIAVPALGNQFISLIKDSTLASVITVSELLLQGRNIISFTFQPVPVYLMLGLIYFLLSNGAARIVAVIERHYNRPYAVAR